MNAPCGLCGSPIGDRVTTCSEQCPSDARDLARLAEAAKPSAPAALPAKQDLLRGVVAMELAAEAERDPSRRASLEAVRDWMREFYIGDAEPHFNQKTA